MAFYSGKYLVDEIEVERENWFFSQIQHMEETSNPEELRALPEDFKLVPERVQHGSAQWGKVLFSLLDQFYPLFTPDSAFYPDVFLAIDNFYPTVVGDIDQFYFFEYTATDLFYPSSFVPVDLFYPIQINIDDLFYTISTDSDLFYPLMAPGLGGFYLVPEEA